MPTMQVTKLDTDPASALAKPGSAAPAKGAAPPPTLHDPSTGPWVRFWADKPQHWGMTSDVKSAPELADANMAQASAAQAGGKSAIGLGTNVVHQPENQTCANINAQAVGAEPEQTGQSVNCHQEHQHTAASDDDPGPSTSKADQPGPHLFDVTMSTAAASGQMHLADAAATHPDSASLSAQDGSGAAAAGHPAQEAGSASAPEGAAAVVVVQPAVGVPQGSRAADAIKAAKHRAFNMYSPSKGTLKVLHKPPANKASPRKQIALDDMLKQRADAASIAAAAKATTVTAKVVQPVQAAATDAAATDARSVDGSTVDNRQELDQATDLASDPAFALWADTAQQAQHAQQAGLMQRHLQRQPQVVLPLPAPTLAQSERYRGLQGLSLSQIDASVFAALPAQHQQELLNNLPKNSNRQDHAQQISGAEGQKQLVPDDFGFITKLANLQKAGHAQWGVQPALSSQEPLDADEQAEAAVAKLKQWHNPPDDQWVVQQKQAETPVAASAQADQSSMLQASPSSPAACQQHDRAHAAAADTDPRQPVFLTRPRASSSQAIADVSSPEARAASLAPLSESVSPESDVEGIPQPPQRPDSHQDALQHQQQQQQVESVRQTAPADAMNRDVTDQASAEAAAQHAILEDEVPGNAFDHGMGGEMDVHFAEEELAAFAVHAVSGPGTYDAVPHHPLHSFEQALPQAAKPQSGQAAGQISAVHAEPGSAAAAIGQQGNADVHAAVAAPAQQQAAGYLAACQIDASVLAALPLQVRKELELAYGVHIYNIFVVHSMCQTFLVYTILPAWFLSLHVQMYAHVCACLECEARRGRPCTAP